MRRMQRMRETHHHWTILPIIIYCGLKLELKFSFSVYLYQYIEILIYHWTILPIIIYCHFYNQIVLLVYISVLKYIGLYCQSNCDFDSFVWLFRFTWVKPSIPPLDINPANLVVLQINCDLFNIIGMFAVNIICVSYNICTYKIQGVFSTVTKKHSVYNFGLPIWNMIIKTTTYKVSR